MARTGVGPGDREDPLISVIIPTLNEAAHLPRTLEALAGAAGVEVTVVDGGSRDGSLAVAQATGAITLVAEGGRGAQMNQGAAQARGELLLFLHGDTLVPRGFEHWIRHCLGQPGVVAGAFDLAIDGPGWGLRWVEWGVKQRSRWLQLPYGDQGLFLRADDFRCLGGFPALPIMEDFALVQQLRRRGRIARVPLAVITSARRWQRLGVGRTTLINQIMVVGYSLGIPPGHLARWYGRL
jgi:rSAM/selenodomain-associated transferase 2